MATKLCVICNAYLNMEDSPVSPHPAQSTATALQAVRHTALIEGAQRLAAHAERMKGSC